MILLSPDNSASFGQTTDHWKDGMTVHLHLHMMLTAAMLAEHHQPIYLYSTLQEHVQIYVISLYDEKLHTEMTKKFHMHKYSIMALLQTTKLTLYTGMTTIIVMANFEQ